MTQENISISFVGQKISKLCWCMNRDGSLSDDEFVTGGWDEQFSNQVTIWKIPDENITETTVASEPYAIAKTKVREGSITDLKYTSASNLIYSTSTGSLSIMEYDRHNNQLEHQQTWYRLHDYKATNEAASCCCFAMNGHDILTGGEDGRINVLHVHRKDPVRILENADSSNITGMQFLSSTDLLTINSTGQLKIWDTRQMSTEKPHKVLTLSGNACPLLSVDKHPNQPHIVVTGHGDGVIGIWDTRQEKAPVTLIDAHESEVWQVKFHSLYPDNLFTCSEDGSCWFWAGSSMISEATHIKTLNETTGFGLPFQIPDADPASSSVWLYVDANKHKMETFSLIPFNTSAVNTFDVNTSRLICGTDNEAIIAVNNIPLR